MGKINLDWKRIFGTATIAIVTTVGAYFATDALAGDGDGVNAGVGAATYAATVTLEAEGKGIVDVEVADAIIATLSVDGKTSDLITFQLPSAFVRTHYHNAADHVALKGVLNALAKVHGKGDIRGEVKVTVTTPFGQMEVYDKPFAFSND